MDKIKVLWVNNAGAGNSNNVEVCKGTTVGQFLNSYLGSNRANYTIRLNREEAISDAVLNNYVLQEGDRLSATPNKVTGA